MTHSSAPAIAIVGPTASGKTGKAVALANAINGEIISGDSRQVYIGMDLGTGKDLEEYGSIPYHLIDICPAGSKYSLYGFLNDARAALTDIERRGKRPIVCGGTGMYVEALINGTSLPEVPENKELRNRLSGKSLDELTSILASMKTLHNTTDIDTAKRAVRAIEIQTYYNEHGIDPLAINPLARTSDNRRDFIVIGIDIDREERRQRITSRLKSRLASGMIEEVKGLLERGVSAENLIYYGLEYKYLTLHVLGELTYKEMFQQLEIAIHQFAKRQMTWFRGMERRGTKIHWLPYDMPDESFINEIERLSNSINAEKR